MRYLVFSGEIYYARGGASDINKGFDDIDDAASYAEGLIDGYNVEWWNILDAESLKIVKESESYPQY